MKIAPVTYLNDCVYEVSELSKRGKKIGKFLAKIFVKKRYLIHIS